MYTVGVNMIDRASYVILIITIISGIFLTVGSTPASGNTPEERRPWRSVTDTIKTYIFSLGSGFYNRFGRKSDDNNKNTTTVEIYPYDDNENIPAKTHYNKQGEEFNIVETNINNSASSQKPF